MPERPISRDTARHLLGAGRIITVQGSLGSKSTRVLRGSKSASQAYVMLRELFDDRTSAPERDR
jgi:hypothetical protein